MVTREDEENMKKELKKMEEENAKEIEEIEITEQDELQDKLLEKYSETQLQKLRELGLKDTKLLVMTAKDTPFNDFNLSGRRNISDILDAQNKFYATLINEFKKDWDKAHIKDKMDEFEYNITIKRDLKNLDHHGFQYNGTDPTDLGEWSKNKQNSFERKKILVLKQFFDQQKEF